MKNEWEEESGGEEHLWEVRGVSIVPRGGTVEGREYDSGTV